MNKERVLALADAIEKAELPEGVGFNMKAFVDDSCGTTCCIAGLAVLFSGKSLEELLVLENNSASGLQDIASEYLGLTQDEALELYYPSAFSWRYIQPSQAVRTLRNLAATGAVVWGPAE